MDFNEQKKQIQSLLEIGDLKMIAKKAGCTYRTVWSAHKKNSLEEMTPTMLKAWNTTVTFLLARKAEKAKMKEKGSELISSLES